MHDLVNLAVDLRSGRFDESASSGALRALDAAGFRVERSAPGNDAFLSWIDAEFGGAWSSEAFAGKNLVARSGSVFAGFAIYESGGIPYVWLRGVAKEPAVGIFGPFGVAPAFRGSPLGPNLLIAALCGLREAGYERALIPAVGDEKLVRYYASHCGAGIVERFDRSRLNARKHRAVVLASGNGSNFQSVIDNVAAGTLPLEIELLVSNKTGAFALERARRAGIAAVALPWERSTRARADYDADLRRLVRSSDPDLVLLLGWMHLLDDAFVASFAHVLNIHPAFLPLDQSRDEVGFPDGSTTPAFRGAHAVRDALRWGSRWVGASCHRVTLDADRGPVLVRKPLAIAAGEQLDAVMERLHPIEHRVLEAGIKRWSFEQ